MLVISASKNDKAYYNRKGFVIFTIVTDFILMALMLLIAIAFNEDIRILFLIIAALLLFSAVIKIVDLAIFNKRVKTGKADVKVRETQPVSSNIDFGALSKENDQKSVKNMEEELNKLDEMKSSGLITEEEYKSMRQKIIEK